MNNRFKFRVWDFTIKRFDTEIYQAGEQLVNQTPHLNRFKHLEVVGNIFENPELLK